MKLLHKGLVLISLPLAFEITFACGFGSLLKSSMNELQAEVHAKNVIAKGERLLVLLSESSILAGMQARKGPEVKERWNSLWHEIAVNYRDLEVAAGKKVDKSLLSEIKQILNFFRGIQKMAWIGASIEKTDAEAAASSPNGSMLQQQLSEYMETWYLTKDSNRDNTPVGRLIKFELKSVKQGPELHKHISDEFNKSLLYGFLGLLGLVTALAVFFGQNIERRLSSLMETTKRLSKGDDLLPPIKGHDELARLDLLLHDTASSIIETQKFKRQLLGVVCHELKAPLSAVKILLSLVLEEKETLNEKALSGVQRASTNCNRLQVMLTELLDLESMNADKIKLNCRSTKPAEIMEAAADMVKDMAKDKSLELVLEPVDVDVVIDRDRMIQVLINLLSNAIKFSPNQAKIFLRAKDLGANLEFSVTDQGPGIPAELHESLFEVFTQAEQPKDSKVKGTGMGLSIARSIVQAHGGSIKIISNHPEGACFRITVPKSVNAGNTALSASTKSTSEAKKAKPFIEHIRIRHKGIFLIGLPLLNEIILLGMLTLGLQQVNAQLEKESTARQVITQSQRAIQEMTDSAMFVLLCPNIADDRIPLYKKEEERIRKSLDELKKTCSSSPRRNSASESIAKIFEQINAMHYTAIEKMKAGPLNAEVAGDLSDRYLESWSQLKLEVDKLTRSEENLEAKEEKRLESLFSNLDNLLLVGLATNILSAIGLAVFLSQSIGKRIGRVQENAERILNREPLLPPVTGYDEIAHLDKAFHEAATALKQEQELKQKLLAIASHELRSPLTAVMMALGMLTHGAMGELSEKNLKRIGQAEAGTERLIALINDILDIEKMEAGKFVLSIEEMQAKPLVARAIACVQPLAEQKNIRVVNQVEDRVIKADSERLTQVMINLLSNALKFSPDGQTVNVGSHMNDDGLFIITIEDSGSGIASEMQDRIFEAFVKDSSNSNSQGTGLGLPISKAIIEQHGGSIGCDSLEGKGARFWFSLPVSSST